MHDAPACFMVPDGYFILCMHFAFDTLVSTSNESGEDTAADIEQQQASTAVSNNGM